MTQATQEDVKHRASCLCGAVQFAVDGDLGEIGHCHCKMCQKAHGAAFGTYVSVRVDQVHIDAGEDLISRYASSPGVERTFCKLCGATLQFFEPDGKYLGITAGCFDTPLPDRVDYEIWTSAACNWGSREGLSWTHATEPPHEHSQ